MCVCVRVEGKAHEVCYFKAVVTAVLISPLSAVSPAPCTSSTTSSCSCCVSWYSSPSSCSPPSPTATPPSPGSRSSGGYGNRPGTYCSASCDVIVKLWVAWSFQGGQKLPRLEFRFHFTAFQLHECHVVRLVQCAPPRAAID